MGKLRLAALWLAQSSVGDTLARLGAGLQLGGQKHLIVRLLPTSCPSARERPLFTAQGLQLQHVFSALLGTALPELPAMGG